jgi:putative peptide zinc metalloprotease protein
MENFEPGCRCPTFASNRGAAAPLFSAVAHTGLLGCRPTPRVARRGQPSSPTVAFLAACWWVLMVKGVASATHEAFANPAPLLLILAVTVLSAGFHEFGHAAAARRGGATPGAMGAGLNLIWPAFYTDVTDSYRLGRGGRIRTFLGRLYFNAMVAVAIMAIWWATGYDALLLVVVTQILQMVRLLLPLLRFDGYQIQ